MAENFEGDFNKFEDVETEQDQTEEKEGVLKLSQEDFDKLRVLAAEDPESDELMSTMEQYALEMEGGSAVEVEVDGEVVELEGFRLKGQQNLRSERNEMEDVDFGQAA